MSNPPTILTNGVMGLSGSGASIASATGNLLMYTNGATVWNQNHLVMANGTGLAGSAGAYQNAVIVKQPGNSNIYFVFTQGQNVAGLKYSTIDMTLAAGQGSVITKNTALITNCTGAIAAVKHCNGTDIWVLVHDYQSTNFRAFLVSSIGVSSVPVSSAVGTLSCCILSNMRISQNGKKIVLMINSQLALYDFDISTGLVSNEFIIGVVSSGGGEFSPDCTKLYASKNSAPVGISQWDLCAGSNTAILASQYTMTNAINSGPMQLAPDGKIYVTRNIQSILGVINNPNNLGALCNYVELGQSISPKTSSNGLPNFVSGFFNQPPPANPYTYTVSNAFGCQTALFAAPQIVTNYTAIACGASSGYSLVNFFWDFGDPASGTLNTSTLINPTHAFTNVGTYTVELILNYSCGGGTDTLKQIVNILQPCITITSSSVSCITPGSATVSVNGGSGPYSYTWMPSAQIGSVATVIPGTYTVTLFNALNNTTFNTTATFTSAVPFNGTLSNTSLLNCNGINSGTASINLSGGSGGQNYVWSNGIVTQTAAIAIGLGIGIYSLNVSDALTNCAFSQTFQITQPPALTLNVSSASPTACAGNSVVLSSSVSGGTPGYSYSWTSGPVSATCNTSQSAAGGYVYTLTVHDFNNCLVTNTIALSFINNPVLSVSNVSICPGAIGTLNVSGASSYTWLPSLFAGSVFTASPAATIVYSVSGSALGCSSSATAAIVLKPLPSLTFNTFSITCASLGSATVNATGGIGPFSYTWSPTLQTTSVVTNLNPNTYTLTVFDLGTSCTSTSSTVFTSLIPLTGTLVNTNSLSCHGLTTGTAIIASLSGGSGNQNYLWSNGISTYTVANPINLSAGTWSSLVTDALTGCTINNIFVITQPPALTLNIGANTPTTCVGTNIILTGTNSGGSPGYTYTWTNGPLIDTYTVNGITAGNYVYTLTSIDANSCLISNTISLNFVPNPTLSVSDVSICPLAVGTLSVSGATSYTWNSVSVGSTFTNSPVSSGQYTVVGSALGCTSMSTASIIVMPTPNPFVISNSPRCNGDNLMFTGFGGALYAWNGPSGFNSVLQNPNINPVSINNAGVYNLTVTAVNGCTASITKTIVVNPTPALSATGNTVCTSQTLNLSASLVSGANYLWSGPLSFTSNSQNPFIINPLITNTGTYTVKMTSPQSCTNSAIAIASVVLPPSLTAQLSSYSLCSQAFNGSPNTITLTAGGASTYTLVTVPDMFNANPGGPVSPLIAIPPNTGAASATLSGSNGVCTVTTGLTFFIIPNPTVSVGSSTPVICAGDTYTYTSQGAGSYSWSSATPGFTTYNNGGVAVASPSIHSVFSVFGASLGCNSASETSTITVKPLPLINLSPGIATVCIGSKVNLIATGTGNSYTWSPYLNINSMYGSTINAFPTSQQTYTVLGSLNSCTSAAMITVSVLSLPNPVATVLKPTVCLNETVTLQGSGGETYKWYGPNSIFYEGQTVSFAINSYIYAGTYTLTVADKNNCKASATTFVTINNLPDGSLLGTQMKGCVPFKSDFTFYSALATSTSIATQWAVDSKIFSTKSFSNEFKVPGTYTITGNFKDTLTNCINTRTFMVEAYAVPLADFIYFPEKPIENLDEVIFTNTSKGEEQKKWDWFFVNNQGYRSQNKNTEHLFTEAGLYPIAMIVTNTWGCADTVVKSLKVESDLTVYVPNVFTPNGDDLNEVFLPIVRAIKSYELLVFDRWGAKIFSTTNTEAGWDGTYQGEQCKVDVYVWKINLSSVNGEMKTLTGSVLLNR